MQCEFEYFQDDDFHPYWIEFQLKKSKEKLPLYIINKYNVTLCNSSLVYLSLTCFKSLNICHLRLFHSLSNFSVNTLHLKCQLNPNLTEWDHFSHHIIKGSCSSCYRAKHNANVCQFSKNKIEKMQEKSTTKQKQIIIFNTSCGGEQGNLKATKQKIISLTKR